MPVDRYVAPGWLTQNVFNRGVAMLNRLGVSLAGSRELRVRGRSSGTVRATPVNVLTVDGERFLVSPRGVTDWVRNLRAAGEGELRVGRRTERFRAVELPDAEKPPVLREYLRRWKMEVGRFFDGADSSSPPEQLMRIAPNHPVFRIEPL